MFRLFFTLTSIVLMEDRGAMVRLTKVRCGTRRGVVIVVDSGPRATPVIQTFLAARVAVVVVRKKRVAAKRVPRRIMVQMLLLLLLLLWQRKTRGEIFVQ